MTLRSKNSSGYTMLSGLSNSMELMRTSYNQTGSGIFKMAAVDGGRIVVGGNKHLVDLSF